ncbi:MAG: nucleotidyl transferase AbiEii/AbiGii toxin family protein [Patulibacter sp.]
MKYDSPVAFRNALEARLKAQQTDAVGLSRLHKRIVFERLLARIQAVTPDRWVLKGGFALELRLGLQARTTKDVDVDWTVDESAVTEFLLDAADHDLDDHFTFTIERLSTDLAGGGQRWTVLAELAGREFERVAIDIGHDRPPVIAPDSIATSQLLEFAGVAPISVPALAIEQHLAEKFHAYSRCYAGNAPSSRVKDLVDIAVVTQATPIDGDLLLEAVDSIVGRRATHDVPHRLPPPLRDWARPWERLSRTSLRQATWTMVSKKQMHSEAQCSLIRS